MCNTIADNVLPLTHTVIWPNVNLLRFKGSQLAFFGLQGGRHWILRCAMNDGKCGNVSTSKSCQAQRNIPPPVMLSAAKHPAQEILRSLTLPLNDGLGKAFAGRYGGTDIPTAPTKRAVETGLAPSYPITTRRGKPGPHSTHLTPYHSRTPANVP